MGDPLFVHGLNLAVWIILLVKVVVVFAIVMVSVLFMVMYERKAVAWLGVRYGPNRAGPNGWLQSLADGTKLLFKEAFTPRGRGQGRLPGRPVPDALSRPCWSSPSCPSAGPSPSPATPPACSWPTRRGGSSSC